MKCPALPLALFLFALLFCGTALCHEPLNLDFEKKSVEGAARPWGWSVFQQPAGATFSLDSTTVRSGRYSFLFSDEKPPGEAASDEQAAGFWVSPHELRGKNWSVTGWVKTEKADGMARVSIGSYGDTGLIKEVKTIDYQGVGDWRRFELAFREDGEAHSYFIILTAIGGGKTWFDGLQLNTGGAARASVELAADFTKAQRHWLEKNCAPLATIEPSPPGAADFPDLMAFRRAVGPATVIALGEATHGTSEFFRLKHRLLQFAVAELGARTFAIEANQLEVEKINRYVHGGEGAGSEVIKVMFRVWNTEEMLALIEWVRAHNLAEPGQSVSFVGFDLQDPSLPMDSLSAYTGDREPALRPLIDSLQLAYRAAWRARYYPQATDSVRAVWKENAEKVLKIVESRASFWRQEASSAAELDRLEWALQNARVVFQAADIALSQKVSGRDTFMAENIRWIQSRQGPGARTIVWAHDSHIARSDHPDARFNYHGGDSMGKYLSRIFGDGYRAFALFTAEGRYSATVSFTNHKMVAAEGMTAPRGSFDEALHRIAQKKGTGQLFLDLRHALQTPDNGWLLEPRPVRFVGYANNDLDFGATTSVPYQFDGVFFVDKTSPSRLLR